MKRGIRDKSKKKCKFMTKKIIRNGDKIARENQSKNEEIFVGKYLRLVRVWRGAEWCKKDTQIRK